MQRKKGSTAGMKVVVVGDGKVGGTLTEQLSREGHDVTVIDKNRKVVDGAANVLDVMAICGNGASHLVQIEAGVPKADLLIAATNSDELNMLCCLVAKKLGARHTIARVRNPEYNDQLEYMREELGLSMAINPEYAAAREMFRMLRFPSALRIETFSRGKIELVEIRLREGSALDGLCLRDLAGRYKVKVLVCAVERGDEVIIPSGEFVLAPGDRINLAAAPVEIEKFFRALDILKQEARSVMIVGGSRVAYYLARMMLEIGVRVKIIDRDPQRCSELCGLLPKAIIIQGDGADQDLLLEEGIAETDAFVALTGIDEENIILSMYAASQKTGKVISKVNRSSLIPLVQGTGLESIISPKEITANRIISFVRALQNSLGSNVETLYKVVGGRVEALEFRAKENSPLIGIPLKDLRFRPNLLIAGIARGRSTIFPGGDDAIRADDRVIVVTTNTQLRDLSDILS